MICIEKKENCCGCSACSNICPKNCISMERDEEGFFYPKVCTEKCINCGLCNKVCPIENNVISSNSPDAVIARNCNNSILDNSTSGGVFTAICEFVIQKGGVVYGVGFDNDFSVRHFRADNIDDCSSFKGSKYVESNLNDSFKKIKNDLKNGLYVCFSGMPCQVAGLKKYLSQEYDNLLTVDLVCHGVPSSQLWEKHLEDLKVKYKSDVESINFRSKIYGYQCGAMKIDFKNQKKYIASSRIDPYMKSFLKNISLRESCYVCKFKTINHNSDLTLFDCWYPEELISNPKNDGYTSIIVQTDKGRHLINQLDKKLFLYNVDLKKMLPVNGGAIVKSALRNSYRDNFYKNVETKDINYAVNQCYKITKSDFIVEKMKGILQKLHVLELTIKLKIFVKKMRRRKFKNV